MVLRLLLVIIVTIAGLGSLSAQKNDEPIKVVEFSGMVFYEDEKGNPAPLPYTNVVTMGTSRGAAADFDGFFHS